ncbi:hypothetical protein [Pantoea sp. CCBC3-3-1]|uniref:hypothetical protein n=1 Tax=Pantoea sp. CCBC3-3-1 TaxID=2490851 RepID=UPI0011BF9107|nr:hypothetical protein [Pantoea sp. CCBC3-3-1]
MLKNRVYKPCQTGEVDRTLSSSSHQVKFLFSRLQDLVPTNQDCYLSACNGSLCIIDRYRPAVAGSRVLIDIAGRCEWARVRRSPEHIVTEQGRVITGEELKEVTIIGVAIHEVVPTFRPATQR